MNTLREIRGSYACTYPSLEIDFDAFLEEKVNTIYLHNWNIILVNGLLFIFTMTQFYCHYKLMMLWFIENPKDGRQIARRIQVGIPPDSLQSPDLNAVSLGLTVPEADREVRSQPLAI